MDKTVRYAQQRSEELKDLITQLEMDILAKLQTEGSRLEHIGAMEVELAALVAEADDAATVMQYYQKLGEMQKSGDVFKRVFMMDRALTVASREGSSSSQSMVGDDAALAAAIVHWSNLCPSEDVSISGIAIATRTVVFFVLEGEEEAVNKMTDVIRKSVVGSELKRDAASKATFSQSPISQQQSDLPQIHEAVFVPSSFLTLRTIRIHSCVYPIGVKLTFVEDSTMDTILSKCREVIALGVRFAPDTSASLAIRGGNPSTEVIDVQKGVPLLLISLAYQHGVVHSPAVYHQLARCVEHTVAAVAGSLSSEGGTREGNGAKGHILEHFGEHMIISFDRRGKWPSNPLMEVATRLLTPSSSLSASASPPIPMAPSDLHVVLHMGDITYTNSPHCVAYGEGIRQIKKLAFVAEASQRPLVISPTVLLHCSKAQYRTEPFSHNTVGYYTFPSLTLTRSVQLPEPFKIDVPAGKKVVDPQPSSAKDARSRNTVAIVPLTADEIIVDAAAATPVAGEDSQVEAFKAYFKQLEAVNGGSNGWITKSLLRTFLLSNEAFVVFPHDAPRIDGWINEANSLGPERISLDEFLYLCVRMKQL